MSDIFIYDTNTFENKWVLKGLTGIVSHIQWLSLDSKVLCSSTLDTTNLTHCWAVDDSQKRIFEHVYKNHKYNSVLYVPEFDYLIACCSDMKMKVFGDVSAGGN